MSSREEPAAPVGTGQIPDYETYDFASVWRGRGIADAAERAIVRMWALPGGGSALDLGGGFGRITGVLEALYKNVFMVDYSRRNLNAAVTRLRKTTTLVRCELEALPFEDNAFDFISLIRVMHHIAEPRRLLAEVARVGRDGGTFAMSDPSVVTQRLLKRGEKNGPGGCVGVGPQGHLIYATRLEQYDDPSLVREEIRGVGWFDNKIGVRLQRLGPLSSVDVATSKLWPAKTNLFLRFRVSKNGTHSPANAPAVVCVCGGTIAQGKCVRCGRQYGRVFDLAAARSSGPGK